MTIMVHMPIPNNNYYTENVFFIFPLAANIVQLEDEIVWNRSHDQTISIYYYYNEYACKERLFTKVWFFCLKCNWSSERIIKYLSDVFINKDLVRIFFIYQEVSVT